MDYDVTRRVLAAFEREGVRYVIFGGVALNPQADRLSLGDITVPVASPATLYRMKRDTVRLKDKADAELLKDRFKLED